MAIAGCTTLAPIAGGVRRLASRTLQRQPNATDHVTEVVATDVETVDLTATLVVHCPPERRAVETLDEAYLRFEECAGDDEQYRRRRNRVQERLAAASNAQCGAYKRRLRETPSSTSTPSRGGSLARAALTGLGMAAPPVAVVKGLADAVRSVRGPAAAPADDGEVELTRRVVSLGIDTRRAVLLQAIRQRQHEGLDTYPVETAVADVLAYHDACSAVGGLEAAADALAHTDPGVGETRAAFARDATDTATTAIARTREQLTMQRDRLTSLAGLGLADAPVETDAAQTALASATTVVDERSREAATARDRARRIAAQLDVTTDPRLRAALVADVDVEVSRAVRASSDVDEAYAAARAAVDAVAARVVPLHTEPAPR